MRIYFGLGRFLAGDKEVLVFLPFKSITMELQIIREKIYEIRGQKVMLDFDLAELYGVETRIFNQAVKRNSARFPEDFMFQLTAEEWERWSQFVTTSEEKPTEKSQEIDNQSEMGKIRRSQFVISSVASQSISTKFRKKSYLPYAFTEHGVSMLASVLRSEKAVQMSIAVVRAFIALKQYVSRQDSLSQQLQEVRDRLGEHDVQLNSIYEAIENLLDEKVAEKKWKDRDRIGFRR
jgi:phage regulator Rha-like protein